MSPQNVSLGQELDKSGNFQLSLSQQNNSKHKHTVRQVIIIGVFFLLLTLTYASFSTIITYIYEKHEGFQYLGPLLLISNYGTFMLVNVFAPFIKISYKKQLIIGALCYTINYAIEIPVIMNPFGVFLLILGSLLGGFGAAIVWVSQGGFMTALFQKYDIPANYHGRYFGLLNMIIFTNMVLGSLVSTFGLGFLGDTQYFIIITLIGGLSAFFGTFMLENVQKKESEKYLEFKEDEQDMENSKRNLKSQQSNGNQNSPLKWLIFSPDMNIKQNIISIYIFATKMKFFIPMIITDGFILGFVSASVSHFLPQDHYGKVQVGVFLIFMGVGAIVGGYLSGFLSDKFPIMKVGKSSFFVLGICIFLSLPIFLQWVDNIVYSNFLGFMWGFEWHYMDGWLWVICSKIFDGKLQSFALNKFIHSFSFVIYQSALIIYGQKQPLKFIEHFVCVLVLLMLVSLISLIKQENLYLRTEKDEND